jgi:hypothetical protein
MVGDGNVREESVQEDQDASQEDKTAAHGDHARGGGERGKGRIVRREGWGMGIQRKTGVRGSEGRGGRG